MSKRKTAFRDHLDLPAYWRACRAARREMECRENIVSYGTHGRQYAVVVDPPEGRLRPGHYAFYFHGGAWTFGRPEAFVPAAQPWLELGYRVVMPSYRRPPSVGLNRIVEDCKTAIRHFAPKETVIDLQLAGMSAGAHLASLLATDLAFWSGSGWPVIPSAVLACAGPLSFSHLFPRQLFLPRYRHLDPVRVLPVAAVDAPRWQLIHGTGDTTVKAVHSRKFHAALVAKGYQAKLHLISGGTHLDAGKWMFTDNESRGIIRDFIGS